MAKKHEEFYCIGCQEKHDKSKFYLSYNSLHNGGVMPFCKDFIKKEVYDSRKQINLEKFKNILMQMDVPFLFDYWEKSFKDKNESIGTYFKNLNLKQNRGLKWKNSQFENKINNNLKNDENQKSKKDFILTDEMIERWGIGKTEEEYMKLEQFYKKMKEANEIETPQDEFYLKKLSMISMKMDEELENGNYGQVKQLGDLFSKYMADSQFRAMDKTDADKLGGIRNFSTIYSEVEKDGHIPPWEYYRKIHGLTQDILDKTIMHIENFTLKLNKVEQMTSPPSDTPKAEPDEIDLDISIGDDDE